MTTREAPAANLRRLSDRERQAIGKARLQHGGIMASTHTVQDSDGLIGAPAIALTLLAQWELSGQITSQMRQAGDQFHATFQRAALQHLRAADMARVPVSGGRHDGHIIEAARRSLSAAIDALGGLHSYGGDCAWYVLGEDMSMREWSMRPGRPVEPKVAKGVLFTVLDKLVQHYGY